MSHPDQTAHCPLVHHVEPVLGALTLAALALATPQRAIAQGVQLPPSLELRVPKAPTIARGDGASFLAYELHVTNFSSGTLTLRRVEVLSAATVGRALLILEDSLLRRALTRPREPRARSGGASTDRRRPPRCGIPLVAGERK